MWTSATTMRLWTSGTQALSESGAAEEGAFVEVEVR
jgi:hypothetical protein